MSAFLVISGYLNNVNKKIKAFGQSLLWIFIPYVCMETGYVIMSAILPVREKVTELSAGLLLHKTIYTTNAIESLNSVIRHATKKRKIFPTDDSVKKVVYLAIMAASKKWTMPIQNWKSAMNRFSIMFEERVTKYF
jgi:fucose 4-O-acetylase-like acetyltransferase